MAEEKQISESTPISIELALGEISFLLQAVAHAGKTMPAQDITQQSNLFLLCGSLVRKLQEAAQAGAEAVAAKAPDGTKDAPPPAA